MLLILGKSLPVTTSIINRVRKMKCNVLLEKLKKRSGISMLYVLAALIVTGFLGTAMVKMNTSGHLSNAHYKQSASARSAAMSGLIAGISVLENGKIENLTMFKSWLNNNSNVPVSITSGHLSNNGSMKYTTKLLAFDVDNFNVTLQSEGRGKSGSRATITSVYHIDGLGVTEKEVTNWGEENAFFLGDGLSLNTHAPFDINGDVFIGKNTNLWFDSHISGSVFRGNFIMAKASSESVSNFRIDASSIDFRGPTYFGSRPSLSGSSTLHYYNRVGFEWGVEMTTNEHIVLDSTAYWNYSNYSDYIDGGDIDQHGNSIYHNGLYNYFYGIDYGWGSVDHKIKTHNGPTPVKVASEELVTGNVAIKDSLGIDVSQCEIHVHPEVIDESFILDWNSSSVNFTGTLANSMYEHANTWNDFMVIRLNSPLTLVDDGVKFDGKMIILVNGSRIYCSPTGAMTCESDANFTIIGNGGQIENVGGWDYYRGFMWAGPGSSFIVGGAPPAASNIHGAIYAVPGVQRIEWYPPGNTTSFITFDPTVLEELDHDGFLTKENCDASSESNETTTSLIQTQDRLSLSLISLHM